MKQLARKLLAVTMLLSVVRVQADDVSGKTFYLPHAQNGTAVDLFGWSNMVHKFDMDHFYGTFKSQTGYYQNFSRSDLGKYLFFNGTNQMVVGPKETATTNTTTDLYSANLLLGDWFTSTIEVNPKVQTVVSSFDLFVGFNEWVDGLWLTAHAPLVWTRWDAQLTETNITATALAAGTALARDNEFNASTTVAAAPAVPYANATAAFKGDKTYGDMTNPWRYGRIDGAQSKTKLGDVHMTLGYDFVSKENMHFGLGIHALLGAGGKSKADYVFEPVVGYMGRFGVGGSLVSGLRLWERDEEHKLTVNLNADVYTVFDNSQTRSYDLIESRGGVGTRYNLVKKLSTLSTTGVTAYSGEMDSMINVGTQKAKIGMSVAYDVTLMFDYQCGGFMIDFGYTAGGHSAEKFKKWVNTIDANTYILWDAVSANCGTTVTSIQANQGAISVTAAGLITGTAAEVVTGNASTYVIDSTQLDTSSALAPSAMGNVLFGGVNYCWIENDWAPCLGLGASVEFSGSGNKSLDLWGIFLQGNVSF